MVCLPRYLMVIVLLLAVPMSAHAQDLMFEITETPEEEEASKPEPTKAEEPKPQPPAPQPAVKAEEPKPAPPAAKTEAPAPQPSPPVAQEPQSQPPPAPVAQPAPAPAKSALPLKTAEKKKKTKPKAQAKSKAVFDKPKAYIRFLHDSRDFGQISTGSTFPGPADFSFYVAGVFKSAKGTSRSEGDMSTFSKLIYLYSPHFNQFGVVGMYSDSSGVRNNASRPGLYYKFAQKYRAATVALIPAFFPIDEGNTHGRMTMLYSLDFYQKFGVSGHFSYAKARPKDLMSTAPIFYVELTKGVRFLTIYDWNHNALKDHYGWQVGLQFTH